jgi:hypothetical protein
MAIEQHVARPSYPQSARPGAEAMPIPDIAGDRDRRW